MASSTFVPDRDISSLAGKVIFVTGGTQGLGASTVETFAKKGAAHIFFSGRNQKTADAVIAKVKNVAPSVPLTFIKNDISSLASVQEAANTFKAASDRLDILMLNAGVMAIDAGLSADGYENHFATNHLGHALLIKLLLPVLQRTAAQPNSDVRIINLASVAYLEAPKNGIDFDTLKTEQRNLSLFVPAKWARYGQSKLANMLYPQELAKRYPEITSVAVHPGVIKTGLIENLSTFDKFSVLIKFRGQFTPVDEGYHNQCWAATVEKSKLVNGEYYEPIGRVGVRKSKPARDTQLSERLWSWTQEQIEHYQ